jgi:hypothetical protein
MDSTTAANFSLFTSGAALPVSHPQAAELFSTGASLITA